MSEAIQCSRVRIGSMATLGELPEKERKELVHSLAKEIWQAVETYGVLPALRPEHSLGRCVYTAVSNSELLHESNFYGKGFNAAQVDKIKEFREHRNKAFEYAEQYDKDIANGVGKMAPGFARKSDELRRTWDIGHIMLELVKADSPFATLRTADAVEDQDRSDESNDEVSDEGAEEQDSDSDRDSDRDSDSDSDSDCEANKALDKADEEDAEDSGDSESESESESGSGSGSERGSGSEELPPKRMKLERAAARSHSPGPPSQALTGDDSDLSDA